MSNRWSMEEESLLAHVWLAVSESRHLVNNGEHRNNSFWNVVTQRFNDQTNGEHRIIKIVLWLNGYESTLNVEI